MCRSCGRHVVGHKKDCPKRREQMKFEKGGGVSWSKADHERAKREGKKLFVIGISEPGQGEIEQMIYMGVGDPELIKKIGRVLVEELAKDVKTPETPGQALARMDMDHED